MELVGANKHDNFLFFSFFLDGREDGPITKNNRDEVEEFCVREKVFQLAV